METARSSPRVRGTASPYMREYNDMKDEFGSELLAESFRFVAVHGFGKNKIADIVVRSALLW